MATSFRKGTRGQDADDLWGLLVVSYPPKGDKASTGCGKESEGQRGERGSWPSGSRLQCVLQWGDLPRMASSATALLGKKSPAPSSRWRFRELSPSLSPSFPSCLLRSLPTLLASFSQGLIRWG